MYIFYLSPHFLYLSWSDSLQHLTCGYVKMGETNLIFSLKMILGLQVTSAQDNDREAVGWFMWYGLIQDKLISDTTQCKCSFITFAIFQWQFLIF